MRIISLLAFVVLAVGCTSRQDKQEITDRANRSQVTSHQALEATIQQTIQDSEHLSDEQKLDLQRILEANKQRAVKLAEESYRYRAVLVQELLASSPSKKKIRFIKRTISKIEKDRMKNTFDAIEKISSIVSKNPDKIKFKEPLSNFERSLR